jgi:hypothetical protein
VKAGLQFRHMAGKSLNNHENLGQYSRLRKRDFNERLPEWEAGLLPTRLQCPVCVYELLSRSYMCVGKQ